MKSFLEALASIKQDKLNNAPIPCAKLQQLAANYAPRPTVPATTADPVPTKWEARALARVIAVLGSTSQGRELLAALGEVPAPLALWVDEDGDIQLGFDTMQYTTTGSAGRWVSVGLIMPDAPAACIGETNPQTPEEAAALEALADWMPQVHGYHNGLAYAELTTTAAMQIISTDLSTGLAEYQPSNTEAMASSLATYKIKHLPSRLWLAAHAPAVPEGWRPNGEAPPSYPIKNWQHWDTEIEAKMAAHEKAVEAYAVEFSAYQVRQETQWPLAWADEMILIHTAQQ